MPKYQNTQKWCECSLISMWNAARYYELDHLAPEFLSECYVDVCKASGAWYEKRDVENEKNFKLKKPIMKAELNRLGLRTVRCVWDFDYLSKRLPIKFAVYPYWIKPRCNIAHAVLAVDVNRDRKEFLLVNYMKQSKKTDVKSCWLTWEKLCDIKHDKFMPISYCRR